MQTALCSNIAALRNFLSGSLSSIERQDILLQERSGEIKTSEELENLLYD